MGKYNEIFTPPYESGNLTTSAQKERLNMEGHAENVAKGLEADHRKWKENKMADCKIKYYGMFKDYFIRNSITGVDVTGRRRASIPGEFHLCSQLSPDAQKKCEDNVFQEYERCVKSTFK